MPKNGEHFIFPTADGTVKCSGRDQVFRIANSIQDYHARGEHDDDLRGESDGSPPLDTLTDDSGARIVFFGRSQGITFVVITLMVLRSTGVFCTGVQGAIECHRNRTSVEETPRIANLDGEHDVACCS